jgi:GNAT superfamily N-acetyltransferase
MTVREATLEDVGAIVIMGRQFLETDFKGLIEPNDEAMLGVVVLVIQTGVIFVAERSHYPTCACQEDNEGPGPCSCGSRIVGFLALAVLEHPLSGKIYGVEVAWWVDPAYRNGMAGPKMLGCAENYARQKGLSVLKMVAPSGSPHVAAFYERRGYVAVETAYQKAFGGM